VVTASPGGEKGSCAASPCLVSGLTNGVNYTFTVAAISAGGLSSGSAPSLPVAPVTAPTAPGHVVATPVDGGAVVSFSAPRGTGAGAPTSYVVVASPGGHRVTCTASPCTVSGLSEGVSYTFTVLAVNSSGTSGASSPSTPVTVTDLAVPTGGPVAATPNGAGYWAVTGKGRLSRYGDAGNYGSENGARLNMPAIAVAATSTGHGYWEAASDGGVFAFGDAHFFGSMAHRRLDQPVVGLSPVPGDRGYWLAGADGGVFSFGDARYYGGMATKRLNQPIVGIQSTPDGRGYWLVGADGGVFSFGDAAFYGSKADGALSSPVVGIAATPDGRGYWLVDRRGEVFALGDAVGHGSLSRQDQVPIVGIIANGYIGYRLISATGAAYTFGTMP
jgi:hypothetical protein